MKLSQLVDTREYYREYFQETFCMICRNGSKIQALFNSQTYHNQSKTNYDNLVLFHSFENVHQDDQK